MDFVFDYAIEGNQIAWGVGTGVAAATLIGPAEVLLRGAENYGVRDRYSIGSGIVLGNLTELGLGTADGTYDSEFAAGFATGFTAPINQPILSPI